MAAELLNMACRVCGERDVELFLDLGDQPHCNRLIPPVMAGRREPHFPLRVGFCRTCTLVQIDHTIPKEQMFSDYPYVSGTTKSLVAHFAETSGRLQRRYGLKPADLVVDIGSNDGTWLKQYRPFGLRVLGVEPASNVAAIATADGVPTWNRFFNETTAAEIVAKEGAASLVTAAGVFFHLEELHSVVRGVRSLLARDGVFCVQAIYLGGMIQNTAFDQVYHEHLCYYTLRSIKALFARHGLEVFDAALVPIHGGSLEVHVGHPGAHQISSAVGELLADEEAKSLGAMDTYREFAERVWRLKGDLVELLAAYKKAGKTVHCYGAPAKGATLLNAFGIDTDLVVLAAEKNKLKFGFLMPGSRIPIVDEAEVEKPDAYLMLAWNFLDEFIRKERDYLQRGGQFIVPVPELRIVTNRDVPALAVAS